MNADLFLTHYERIADAPDAIPRLRRFVLDAAVRGRLVPQDPNDEPASVSLVRIGDEAATAKTATAVTEQPPPFDLPIGWTWTCLGRLVTHSEAGWSPKTEDHPRTGDTWGVLKVSAVSWDEFRANENKQVLPGTEPRCQAMVRRGDFLISRANTAELVARAVIVDEEAVNLMMSDKIVRLNLSASCNHRYIWVVNNYAYFAREHYVRHATGVSPSMKNVSRDVILALPLPLPPLAEQHRIVSKIDELMALCDRLEAVRADRERTRDRLTTASLARLSTTDSNPVTFAKHVSFALNALPSLTARADQMKRLRQTVVDLAILGRLAIQGDNGKADESKAWPWTRLGALLVEDSLNGYSRRPDDAANGTPMLRISAGTTRRDGVVAEEEHKRIGGITDELKVKFRLQRGDLLACRFNGNKGYVGRLAIFRDYLGISPIFPDKLIRLRIDTRLAMPDFIRLAGDANCVRQSVEAHCATTVGNWGISASNLKDVLFPLPPLAEQHRIIAKVDELMGLCDRLESNIRSADETRRRLLDAVLAEALETQPEKPATARDSVTQN